MDTSAEAKLYDLATAKLGRSFRASGQFHTIADTNPRSLESKSVSEWLLLKTRSRLPAYPYLVVLPDALHRHVTLALPDRRFPAVLEGVYGTPPESDLVTALEEASRRDG